MPLAMSFFRTCLAGSLLLASACRHSVPPTSPPSPCTLSTKIRLQATDRLNPDEKDEPLPTVVRVYQLKDVVMVEQADFATLWDQPKEALGDDLFKAQEYTLFPGKTLDVDVSLAPEVKYLAGVAIFRQPTGTLWRSIVPLPASARMCSAYAEKGAPNPAVMFRFDQYRVESRSHLLSADGEHDLPTDVAPQRDQTPEGDR